jgi:hypothetical protein
MMNRCNECYYLWLNLRMNQLYMMCLELFAVVLFSVRPLELKWSTRWQLVEALPYKPEGRRFDSPWESLGFFIDLILPAAL